jgi:Leucine-rich repeat (LRR) protein
MTQLTSLSVRIDSAAQARELGFPKQLETLRLSGRGITTLNAVSGLKQLHELHLHAPVKDLTPLKRMPQLTDLSLYDVPVDDLSLLASLPNLEDLDVDKMQLQRCSPENVRELREGKSCYEKNGTLKPLWKRWLGF